MQFVHQALTWGFLLALVPLLIHLINMMRHRRVQWAAMEFLLASYKKHRKWIWLKQLLLLLARIAVVALAVAMLAQLKTRDQWLAIFGGRVTHHFVLLDDSFSMSDRVAGESAMDVAKRIAAAHASLRVSRHIGDRREPGLEPRSHHRRGHDVVGEARDWRGDIAQRRHLHRFHEVRPGPGLSPAGDHGCNADGHGWLPGHHERNVPGRACARGRHPTIRRTAGLR